MNKLFKRIPGLRSFIRNYEKLKFHNTWRKVNPHNDTVVGDRLFPIDKVTVGRATYGMLNVQSLFVTPEERLQIGNYVSIAPGVTFILSGNHQTQTLSTFPLYSRMVKRSGIDSLTNGPIIIEDEVWLGTNVIVMSGVRIGKGAIVAAGAIVTKDIPPYAIAGGTPAKVLRYKFSEEIIKLLMPIYLKDFSENWIKENINILYQKIETLEDARRLKEITDSYLKTK